MKTKRFLTVLLFAALIIACNQSKKTKDIEHEGIAPQKEEVAKPVMVKGKVVNQETGESVSMAIIIVKGTTTGTMSGPNGDFMIQAPVDAKKLVCSSNGFETFEADIVGKKEIEVKLSKKK